MAESLEERVRRFVRRLAERFGVDPPRVVFLKRVPSHVKRYAEAHGRKRDLEKYGAMYYDPRDKAIKIVPGTLITTDHLIHEFAHYLQDVFCGLGKTRIRSAARRRLERRADRIAHRIERLLKHSNM